MLLKSRGMHCHDILLMCAPSVVHLYMDLSAQDTADAYTGARPLYRGMIPKFQKL